MISWSVSLARIHKALKTAFCPLLAATAVCAQAGEGDVLRPLASYAYVHDDNLFRLNDAAANADRYQTWGLGLLLDWQQRRQRVRGRAVLNATRFDQNSLLDYDGRDLWLGWDWEWGNHWQGRLGARQNISLGSYQDLGQRVSSLRSDQEVFFDADYRFHSRWTLGMRLNRPSREYSVAQLRGRDYRQNNAVLGLYHQGGALQHAGLELRRLDGEFPERSGINQTTTFSEQGLGGVAHWQASDKTRLRARLGYVDRANKGGAAPGFSGLEYRFDGDWAPSGKLLINAALSRNLVNSEVAGADHEVRDGLSLAAQWQALPKTRLGVTLSRETRDLDGQDDVFTSLGLRAGYEAWPGGDLSLDYQRYRRASSNAALDYSGQILQFNAQLVF